MTYFYAISISQTLTLITIESSLVVNPGGVLAMFAYGGVRAMFLGLKFHLKAIFGV